MNDAPLPIDRVEPGAVLAQDLMDDHGIVLLPTDTVLTEAILRRLRKTGVIRLTIRDAAPHASAGPGDERLAARIDYLFRGSGDSMPMRELRSLVTAYRLGKRP